MAKQYVRSQTGKKRLLVIAAVAIVLLGGGYALAHQLTKSDEPKTTPSGAKLEPATQAEKQDSEAAKDRIVEDQQNAKENSNNQSNSSNPPSSKKQVSVIITNASSNSVNAYITGIFEEGGTCSATFTQGGTTITRTSSAFGNVSYTQCAPITPDLPSGGTWSVTVKYSSAAAEGISASQSF